MARLPRGRRPSDRWRNFDNAWKLALERLLLACLQFFFPQIAALLDEARPIEFLEQELKRISRRTQQRKGAVDLLARAWLRSGQEHWLLLHLEVQSQKEPEFPERMCLYSRRIRERHGRLATSLAILADDVRDWRPNRYREEAPGTVHEFEFTMVKVLDYADQLEELQQSRNPFAVLVEASLSALATGRQPPQTLLETKVGLLRRLYRRGFTRAEIETLVEFIDWVMVLPPDLEVQFDQVWAELEEEQEVPVVSRLETRLTEKGREEQAEEERRRVTRRILERLERRLGGVPDHVAAAVNAIQGQEQLLTLLEEAVQTESLAEFEACLRTVRVP